MSESTRHGFEAPTYRAIAESLVFAVQYAVNSSVEGEIAEFGVQTGRTSFAIAATMRLQRANKELHLFDSFEGLPEASHKADLENEHVKLGTWGKGQLIAITPEQLRKKCAKHIPADSIKIYKGWFSNTMCTIPKGTRFAMLHIDCDLYSSTVDVLDYLFKTSSISEGAVILFDDWGCNRYSDEHGEQRAWKELCERYKVVYADLGDYGWAGHKFIVRRYLNSPK